MSEFRCHGPGRGPGRASGARPSGAGASRPGDARHGGGKASDLIVTLGHASYPFGVARAS